ncbi:MAPEG family protein [Dechloromonas sp. XY25]|uniref:MAPEG family protein n=1 Tax=Dechloromonas hankyongensis TaxID=2908002 RepID=A0ABS9K7P4_9RHOO|nr:MAPEG family protein [Dechloromonas hankyongensis]MCG2579196.1 MAPEG family protein [Dechloromonas hankyongensis]
MHPVVLFCTAALGCLLFLLGLAVSVLRFRSRIGSGPAPERSAPLNRVIRAHANTAEFAPFLAVLFLYFGWRGPSDTALWLIVAATTCRFLLVIGLIAWPSMGKPNPARFVGALGTYIFGAALSVLVLTGV